VGDDPTRPLSLRSPAARRLAKELSDSRVLGIQETREGLAFRAFSYVGTLSIDDIRVTIKTKIEQNSLLRLLRYAYGLRALRLFADTEQSVEKLGFEDLLVHQLVCEAGELARRGLHRDYVLRLEELSQPRGRIHMQAIANAGGVFSASLPCIHFPRSENNSLNQVLLAGLEYAARIADDRSLSRQARAHAASLSESITRKPLSSSVIDTASRQLNRKTNAYAPAIQIIRLLHEARGISLEGVPFAQRVPGFLFDMNRFFQALIGRFLSENLPGYQVEDEHKMKGVMRYSPAHNPRNRRAPTPRPDYLIRKMGKPVSVLDAKYRDLWDHSLPRDMLYQLAIYALLHRLHSAVILYPTLAPDAVEARVDVINPLSGMGQAEVHIRPVLLGELEQLILSRKSESVKRECAKFARSLAFGSDPNMRYRI
jgi:5-methylcytosine-specific restriction enzyme subunit McrC